MKKTVLVMALMAFGLVVSCNKATDTKVVENADTVVVENDTVLVDTIVVDTLSTVPSIKAN